MKKKLLKILKKSSGMLIAFGMLIASLEIAPIMRVLADTNNTKLVIQSNNNVISIDGTDTNKVIYKINDVTVGTAKVKLEGSYVTPIMNNGKAEFVLTEYNGENYQITVEVTQSEGYQRQPSYFYNGTSDFFPGDNMLGLDITANNIHTLDFSFEANNAPGPGPGHDGPQEFIPVYPIVAYFEGVTEGVSMDSEGIILMPNDWTNGKVSFKAKVCESDGRTIPNDGFSICDSDTQKEINVRVEGIANSGQINNTVTPGNDRSYVNILSGFSEYEKLTLHITSVQEGGDVNTIINIITEDLINIKVDAPLEMSYSVGSSAVDQAIITRDEIKDVSIFFGNTEANLIVGGVNVDKITGVTGSNISNVVLNNDGTASLDLPDLSVETTTQVRITILLKDGTSIIRTVNIKRTAIILEYDDRENELRAGYVINKAYLYNNQAHNDSVFNAYLQVILYKDNMVAGYKQIKINDEEIVNKLHDDEAWSIETFDDNPIIIYDGEDEEINGASVFLTNGPVDFNSETLPSIEFGIGSGVKVAWGDK